MRQTKRNRQSGRVLKGQAKTNNSARRHIGRNRQVGASDENSVAVYYLNEVDIGRRVVDLDNIESVGGADVSRPRLETAQVLTPGKPSTGDLLGGKYQRDPLGDRDIGRGIEPFTFAARSDFIDDRREVWLLRAQPHLPQRDRDDLLHSGIDPWPPRLTRFGQKSRHPALVTISRQMVVDLTG